MTYFFYLQKKKPHQSKKLSKKQNTAFFHLFLFSLNIFFICLIGSPRALGQAPTPIVLDPGHGGQDWGASITVKGTLYREKDLTLLIAKKIATLLFSKGFFVVLTRTHDQLLSLSKRTRFANTLHAKLFLSIHINAFHSKITTRSFPGGPEVYLLEPASDPRASRLSELENKYLSKKKPLLFVFSSLGLPRLPHSTKKHLLPQENHTLQLILKDLLLGNHQSHSQQLGCLLQKSLNQTYRSFFPTRTTLHSHPRKALFYVLLGANMPAALLELGFLHHKKDQHMLFSSRGQHILAQTIAHAIKRFLTPSKQHSKCSF